MADVQSATNINNAFFQFAPVIVLNFITIVISLTKLSSSLVFSLALVFSIISTFMLAATIILRYPLVETRRGIAYPDVLKAFNHLSFYGTFFASLSSLCTKFGLAIIMWMHHGFLSFVLTALLFSWTIKKVMNQVYTIMPQESTSMQEFGSIISMCASVFNALVRW